MTKAAGYWTDARLDNLAAALEPVPAQVAVLGATVDHLTASLEPVPTQIAVLAATVELLAEENRGLRAELATLQRQLLQMAWGLVAALLGGAGALLAALI